MKNSLCAAVVLLACAGSAQAAAPVAADDAYSAEQYQLIDIGAPGVLANDTDGDGDPLNAQLVSGPANGSLTFRADGSFRYTPGAGFFGSDSFSYEANDGVDDSNVAVVSLTITELVDGNGGGSYSGGASLGPLTLLLLLLAAAYPRGLKDSKRRAISP